MEVSVGERWKTFVDEAVGSGRYASVSDLVSEGLRLVEEREAKLQALRDVLVPRLEERGTNTAEQVRAAVKSRLDRSRSGSAS